MPKISLWALRPQAARTPKSASLTSRLPAIMREVPGKSPWVSRQEKRVGHSSRQGKEHPTRNYGQLSQSSLHATRLTRLARKYPSNGNEKRGKACHYSGRERKPALLVPIRCHYSGRQRTPRTSRLAPFSRLGSTLQETSRPRLSRPRPSRPSSIAANSKPPGLLSGAVPQRAERARTV